MNDTQSKLPNFFVVGTGKAGTTALYHYLRAHPQVYMSPIKEPNYFAKDTDVKAFSEEYKRSLLLDYSQFLKGDMHEAVHAHIAHITDWADYIQLFRNVRDEKAIGENSNSYLYSSRAAAEIRSVIPHAKIVMVLRNPIKRAYSQYLMDLRIGSVRGSFMRELEKDLKQPNKGWGNSRLYVEMGLYAEQVKRYLHVFPRDRVGIYLYEDMQAQTAAFLKCVCGFLEVDPEFVPSVLSKLNVAKVPRARMLNFLLHHSGIKYSLRDILPPKFREVVKRASYTSEVPKMTEAERMRLNDLFRNDIRRLETLIGRDLRHWTVERT